MALCNGSHLHFFHGKAFDNNVFLTFHRFGDDITVYVFYDGIYENCGGRRFWFGECRFFDNYLGLDTVSILRLPCRVTDRILVFIMLVFFIIYFFILQYFKTVEGCRVVKIFIV